MDQQTPKKSGMLQNILLGYLVLILHIFLIILISVSVVFLEGVHEYLGWILGGGILLIAGSGYFFWRRARRNAMQVGEFLRQAVPSDRPVEISFLGGLAQVRLGASSGAYPAGPLIEHQPERTPQLESQETQRLRQIEKLAEMLDGDLITKAEFRRLKQDLLRTDSATTAPPAC